MREFHLDPSRGVIPTQTANAARRRHIANRSLSDEGGQAT